MDADTCQIVAVTLTSPDLDDAWQVEALLNQVASAIISFTGDGAYDGDSVRDAACERHPDVAVSVPQRSNAVPSVAAGSITMVATQHDRHLLQTAACRPLASLCHSLPRRGLRRR